MCCSSSKFVPIFVIWCGMLVRCNLLVQCEVGLWEQSSLMCDLCRYLNKGWRWGSDSWYGRLPPALLPPVKNEGDASRIRNGSYMGNYHCAVTAWEWLFPGTYISVYMSEQVSGGWNDPYYAFCIRCVELKLGFESCMLDFLLTQTYLFIINCPSFPRAKTYSRHLGVAVLAKHDRALALFPLWDYTLIHLRGGFLSHELMLRLAPCSHLGG